MITCRFGSVFLHQTSIPDDRVEVSEAAGTTLGHWLSPGVSDSASLRLHLIQVDLKSLGPIALKRLEHGFTTYLYRNPGHVAGQGKKAAKATDDESGSVGAQQFLHLKGPIGTRNETILSVTELL
ncbi:unnamed protein product [Protopolystoma xenopodis]|uniref:Uncharacterized protein n=1 Tax=Protopolystoma xenopodis TaxID=117903 RepID=A0A3S5CIM0_9PLAT|nr:unnamed protein product [Protopolystoma xenopodis]